MNEATFTSCASATASPATGVRDESPKVSCAPSLAPTGGSNRSLVDRFDLNLGPENPAAEAWLADVVRHQ